MLDSLTKALASLPSPPMICAVELEQAIAVEQWRTEQNYNDILWSCDITNLAIGNFGRYGYLLH